MQGGSRPKIRRAGNRNAKVGGAEAEGRANFMGDSLAISENHALATGGAIARARLARQT